MKRLLFLVAVLLGGIAALSAQQPTQGQMLEDVIYLNDDTVLRGIIVEQVPAVTYVIATANGKYTIDALSIRKITKEPTSNTLVVNEIHTYGPYIPHKYDEDGNLITPLSPSGAFFNSLIIPGLGQMNNGQEIKGILLFTGTVVGVLGVTVGTNMASSQYVDLVGYSSAVLAAGCYLYSLFDAPIYAYKWNKKHGFKGGGYNRMSFRPAIGVSGRRGAAVGMNVAFDF
ncbi:MAG: hypothetical protein IKY63_03635 [Tidjanibacter sp.]|nr:hypothetical protein [Tidjanibacter sp.]